MPTFRYVIADVFTDAPLTGNQLAVFTDAREIPDEQLRPLAQEMTFSESVFVYPPEQGGHVNIRIFTPAAETPFAGHPVLGTAFCLAGPLQLPVTINLETPKGIVPVELEREGARIVFGGCRSRSRRSPPYDQEAELLAALRDRALGAAHRALRPGDHVRVRRPFLPEEAVAALEPRLRARSLGFRATSVPTASPARTHVGRRACSLRPTAFPRIRRPAPRPGRWRAISPGTDASGSGDEIEISRAPRSAGPARSTRVRTAPPA